MAKFLDDSGLRVLWGLIKGGFVKRSSVSEKSTSLTWNTETEIANIDGKSIKVKIPAAPTFSNTARLQVSDTTNRRINTKESTGNYIQFTGGTNKFTITDGTSSFDVSVTPSISLAHTITVKSGVKSDGSTEITSTSPSADNPTVSLGDSGVSAGIYGPSADVSGSNGNTIKVPQIRVNAKGIVTEISEKTYTSVDTNTHNSHGHTFTTTTPTSIGTTLGWGGTFDVVTALGNASATSGNLSSTYTTYRFQLPGNPNTDSKVTQTPTTSSNTSWRPLILGGGNNYSDATVFAPVNVTDGVLASHLAKFAPSQGIMALVGLKKLGTDGKEVAGSNTTVWNTNGGTTSLNSYLTSQDHYKTSPTAGYYGPSADVTGSNGSTVSIPYIKVDANGHIESITNKTFTAVNSTYTVNNAALSLQVNGASKTTFYANDSTNKTFNIASGTSSSGNGTFLAGGEAVSIYGLASGAYKAVDAESMTASSTNLPTSKAVAAFVSAALTSVLSYKGTIGSSGATVTSLPASHKVGDTYVVSTAGTYAGKACEVGDYIICRTAGSSANDGHWDVINGENQVENKSASLAGAGSSATIATVDGTNLTITTPSTWTGVAKTGTVTSVATGAGLTGGTITGSGTIKVKLKDETANTADSSKSTSGDGGLYAVEVDKSGNLAVRVPWTDHTYTVNNGTLSLQANGTTKTTFTANQSGNSTFNIATGSANGTIAVGGVDVAVKGLGSNAYSSTSYLPTSGGTLTGSLSMNNTSSITNLPVSGGIYWNPYVESSSDPTDVASITLVSSGVAGGTTLVITQNNDANDTIQFVTHSSASLYHNNNKIWDAGNDGSGSGLDADTLDGNHASAFALSGHTHSYLPLSGGTLSSDSAVISRVGTSVAWVDGRRYPIIKTTSYTGYNSILSMKTTNGSWDLGVYSDDKAYLTYITDTNYSAGENSTTYQLTFPKSTGTIALTSQIPTVNNGTLNFQASGTTKATFTANQSGTSNFNIATGSSNGTISVGGTDVAVKGLGSAAYTNSGSYATSGHTHSTTIAADSGTSALNMAANTTYKLTAGGTTFIFKTPADSNTWRGIQDNLTSSNNTTESLSAKQGYLLANGSARDNTKLPLSGGTMTGNIAFSGDNNITWSRNTDYAKIHFKNTGDGDTDSYLGFETADNGNEYFKFGHTDGSTYTEWMSIKSDGVRVKGTKVSLEGHTHSYLPLSGGTMSNTTKVTNLNADLLDGYNASDFATSGHTHTTTIATSSGTSQITLAFGTKYVITAGGTSYVFTMPGNPNTNTWRPIQVGGTDKLTDSSTKLNFASSGSASVSYSSGTITIGCSAAANATADSALTAAEVEALLI